MKLDVAGKVGEPFSIADEIACKSLHDDPATMEIIKSKLDDSSYYDFSLEAMAKEIWSGYGWTADGLYQQAQSGDVGLGPLEASSGWVK